MMQSNRRTGLGGYGRGRPIDHSNSDTSKPGHEWDTEYEQYIFHPVPKVYPRAMEDTLRVKRVYPPMEKWYRKHLEDKYFPITTTYVENPNYFCFQAFAQRRWVEKHEKEIHETVLEAGDRLNMETKFDYKGQPCSVYYRDLWRRGFVIRTNYTDFPYKPKDYVAEVILVDYGDRGLVRMTEMKCLPMKMLKIPPMVIRAGLGSPIIEVKKDCWPKSIADQFKEIMEKKTYFVCTFHTDADEPIVTIRDYSHNCPLCKKRMCSVNEIVERITTNWEDGGGGGYSTPQRY